MAIGAAGTLTVSAFLFLCLQAVKDFLPNLEGRAALCVLYALSGAIAAALLQQSGADWWVSESWLAWVVMTLSAAIIAKGIYAQLFKVSVRGVPLPPDAEVPPPTVPPSKPPEAPLRR